MNGQILLQADPAASNESFFGAVMWLIVLGAPLVLFLLSRTRKRPRRQVTEFDADALRSRVVSDPAPVLVHFYRNWSVGDQVMVAQIEKLASRAGDDYDVAFLDTEKYPNAMKEFTTVDAPALVLFAGGRPHAVMQGVLDEADVDREVRDAVARWRRDATAD